MEAHFLQPCPSHRLTHRSVHLSYMQSTTPPRAHSLLHYANFTTFVFETDWKPNVMHSDFSSWSLRLVPRSSPLPIVYWQHPSSAHQLIQKDAQWEENTRTEETQQKVCIWRYWFREPSTFSRRPVILRNHQKVSKQFLFKPYFLHCFWWLGMTSKSHSAFCLCMTGTENTVVEFTHHLLLSTQSNRSLSLYLGALHHTLEETEKVESMPHQGNTVSTLLSLPTTQIMRADVHLSETFYPRKTSMVKYFV